jgi:REP element-mobilizing transposase RayT
LAGRDSHPLDDEQSFMETSHPPIPFDPQGLVALFFLSVQPFRCVAFRPALSVVQHDRTEALHREEGNEDTANMSPKDKWFRAYAVQQLSRNTDLIAFTIRYHVVLSTRQRTNVFSSEHREQIADMVRQAAMPFEQTTAHVVWLAADHLHLYIDVSPDYALDEIVHAIMDDLERERANLFPALPPSNQPVWERTYFAESIGCSSAKVTLYL